MAHVLVVEDSEVASHALRTLIEAAGHRVSVAASISEAIQVADTDRPHLTLLDLTLPDGNGLAVARHLRSTGLDGVIVALTGHDRPEIGAACSAAGCAEVLVKPVPIRTLLARIEGWVNGSAGT